MSDKPVVLFLCIHNSGRSLAARVLLDHYAEGRIDVRSAGSEPADELNPSVVAVLEERGLDPTREFPKPLTDELAREADVIVTMGCGDTCPVYPGKRYLDWDLEDPTGKPVVPSGPSSTTSMDGPRASCRAHLARSELPRGPAGKQPQSVLNRRTALRRVDDDPQVALGRDIEVNWPRSPSFAKCSL